MSDRVSTPRVGVYPGSFNPFTVAHLAIAEAAVEQHHLDRLHLTISRTALVKGAIEVPTFAHRVEVLAAVAHQHDWLDVIITSEQLLADIADGYDVLVMGADKWHQIHDTGFYGDDPATRDEAIASLPAVAIAPRPPLETPPELALDVEKHLGRVSSSAVRNGHTHWMHPVAKGFDDRTGAWSDHERYVALLAGLSEGERR
ncbi:MAG: hypothetical protein GY708_27200 [Actinomycetia bacterium]|nr:hypothetical protein [Actinomycetes bacterium]MCP4962644.1 hypothetical protein [Actinomycetes bacterium]